MHWSFGLFFVAVAASIPAPDADGKYHIQAEGIKASFIPYAASVTNLFICDRNGTSRDIVLGYDNATAYATDKIHPNYGAIPGRYANRLSNATYFLDGVRYFTERNSPPNSTIHSGTNGWSYRFWNVSAVAKDSITFTLQDASNSSMGFPGLVLGTVTYSVSKFTWSIKIEAEAKDQQTPLMLTNHAYWNLDGFANPNNDTVLGHTLSMPFGQRKIGYDAVSQPDGSLPSIPKGSINDFWSHPKKIGASSSDPSWVGNCGPGVPGYDCQWLVDRKRGQLRKPVASLWSDWSGIKWDMYSNQEGLVMTSCGFFPPNLLPVKKTQGGGVNNGFVPSSGCIAAEAQDWIDGINYPEWGRLERQIYGPTSGTYENNIVYKFSIV